MDLVFKRDIIREVAKRFANNYAHYSPEQTIGSLGKGGAVGEIQVRLNELDLETCSEKDVVDAMLGLTGWVSNECDQCGDNCETLLRIGERPDYEARWQTLCIQCLQSAVRKLEETQPPNVG